MNRVEAKKHHHKLRVQIAESINTTIDLIEALDESPTLVTILGTLTTETHEILIKKRDGLL